MSGFGVLFTAWVILWILASLAVACRIWARGIIKEKKKKEKKHYSLAIND